MATVADVLAVLERLAPARTAQPWDRVGLQVGNTSASVTRVLVSLDVSLSAIQHAATTGCQMIVAHHPLIFRPIDQVTTQTLPGEAIISLVEAGISFAAAHTNWDAAPGGVNDALAAALGMYDAVPLGDPVLLSDHDCVLGRLGSLPAPISLEEFGKRVESLLGTWTIAWGDPDRLVQRIAVIGGAADSEWRSALAAGADVFVTGEVKHHIAMEATSSGLALIAAGHYATEQPGVVALATALQSALPEIIVSVFEPEAGRDGRPF